MGHEQFTWASLIPFVRDLPPHVSNAIVVSIIILFLAVVAYIQLRKSGDNPVPSEKFTVRNFMEMTVEALSNLIHDNMGPRGPEFVLLVGTLALFILFNNLSGLVPGFLPATDNVNTTFACSLTVFFMTHYYGFREHGVKYLKQFMGPLLWLAPIMIPIEIIGHIARPLSLGLRLFGNIFGDHQVTAMAIFFLPLLLPVPAMILGLFVALVQTFVFMLLSMAYFSGAISHEAH
ncbi:MAG TPA: F0F1 ATP synthase subunit A [Syntrophorhabdaceae bacterium]|nr:F0F1 ATP synthase subunit A [Syntrophorhabdaceae bacterium]